MLDHLKDRAPDRAHDGVAAEGVEVDFRGESLRDLHICYDGGERRPVPAEVREIVDSLDPLPATLTNGRFDILHSNGAAEDLFWEWHELPCIHKNTLWCCVTEPSARGKFPQYEQEIPYLVARLRAVYARHVGDPDWEEDIRRLASMSCEFAELWARHEVADWQPRKHGVRLVRSGGARRPSRYPATARWP